MTKVSRDFIPQDLHNKLFDELLDNPFIGINITDSSGKVIFVNEAHTRITGQDPKVYIGRKMQSLYSKKMVSSSAVMEVLKKKTEVLINQDTSCGKSFQVKGIPIFNEHGDITYILNYLLDVSELVEMKDIVNKIQADKEEIEDKYEMLKKTLDDMGSLIYQSKIMQSIVDLAKKVADSDATVLIIGPSGSGKELIANVIHEESKRKDAPFIKINCAAIPEQLLESELFGYEPGAFTGGSPKGKKGLFECAEGGSVLLDEIGELPMTLQAKLLRVLQEREVMRIGSNKTIKVNFRLIASTNASLKDMIAEKRFREDLYYRLNIIEITMPGLGERREDIPLLIEHFIRVFNTKYSLKKSIDFDAVKYLSSRDYPGNVRELRNIVERLIVQSPEDKITIKDAYEAFGFLKVQTKYSDTPISLENRQGASLKEMVAEYEKKILKEYMDIYGNGSVIAEKLKTDQSTISRKLNRYHI